VIWGSAGATVGASYTLLGAAVLFFTSLFLARRLSINFAGNLEEGGPAPYLLVPIQKGTTKMLTAESLAARMAWRKIGNSKRV
jgi:hypothetical protein